jgi:ribose transport system permease protein
MDKPAATEEATAPWYLRLLASQEGIVFALAVLAFVLFSVLLPGFFSTGNLLVLLRSVSILGILALGMALVVIARGIDVSMIAIMVVSVSWSFVLAGAGYPLVLALMIGAGFAIFCGVIIGALIAFGDVPPIFATLAAGSVIYGTGRTFFFRLEMQNAPADSDWFGLIGQGNVLGIPVTIIALAGLCALFQFILSRTRFGWMVYAMGNNPNAARVTGIPFRPIVVAQYAISALIAFVAGLILASSANAINARLFNSTMIYDILLVVVLGGIGLNGGHGSIRNVVLGTVFVGILLNGMTIMNIDYTIQNLVKGVVLLLAIVADSVVNPRDEQTSSQGDL